MIQVDLLVLVSVVCYECELYLQFLFRCEISGIDFNFCCVDGSEFIVLVNVIVIFSCDNSKFISCIVIYDIFECKCVEEEIEVFNVDLECQVQYLYNVNKELESFFYLVLYDLCVFLCVIFGYVMIFEEDYVYVIDEKGCEQLQVICCNVCKMDVLINDLFKLVKFIIGELILQCFLMDELVVQVVVGLQQENFGVIFDVLCLEGVVVNCGLIV